jgi:hypothetical protein
MENDARADVRAGKKDHCPRRDVRTSHIRCGKSETKYSIHPYDCLDVAYIFVKTLGRSLSPAQCQDSLPEVPCSVRRSLECFSRRF